MPAPGKPGHEQTQLGGLKGQHKSRNPNLSKEKKMRVIGVEGYGGLDAVTERIAKEEAIGVMERTALRTKVLGGAVVPLP